MKMVVSILVVLLLIIVAIFSYGPIRDIVSPKAMTADKFDPNSFNIHNYSLTELEKLFEDLFPVGTPAAAVDRALLTNNSSRLRKNVRDISEGCELISYHEKPMLLRDFKSGYAYRFLFDQDLKLVDVHCASRIWIHTGGFGFEKFGCRKKNK